MHKWTVQNRRSALVMQQHQQKRKTNIYNLIKRKKRILARTFHDIAQTLRHENEIERKINLEWLVFTILHERFFLFGYFYLFVVHVLHKCRPSSITKEWKHRRKKTAPNDLVLVFLVAFLFSIKYKRSAQLLR